jgi:hypothetical protein
MIASAARFRIKSAWVIGLTGVLTVIAAVALMAYAAPAHARGRVGPAPGGAHLSADLIHRPPAASVPVMWGHGRAFPGHVRCAAAHYRTGV